MMKVFFLSLFFCGLAFAQSLLQTIPLPRASYYDQGYGLVYKDGLLWMSSGSSTAGKGKLMGLDMTGVAVDSFQINYATIRESQGLAQDGVNWWYIDRKTARGDIMKVSPAGQVLDSILTNQWGSWYIGGAAWDGTGIWVSVYYPDAQAGVYKIDPVSKQIVDTISVFGLQPQGVTIKGDTLFYVMDGFQGDAENIYAVHIPTEDTLFSFHVPELPGTRQNPRGLAWDGNYLWLMAEPIGASSGRALFKYDLRGSGSPGITLLNPSINFANVQVDSTRSFDVLIKNYGTANLVIDSFRVSNPDFTFEMTVPSTIKPDSIKAYKLSFKPTANIVYNDSIFIYHNDPNFVFSKVKMQGRGVYTLPYLDLSHDQISYGQKRRNSTSYFAFDIMNEGSGVLNVDSMSVKDKKFYFYDNYGSFSIDSLTKKNIRLWFSPPVLGEYADTLLIYSNASNGNLIKLPLNALCQLHDSTLGAVLWRGVIPDNPATSADDLTARFIKNAGDLNKDGVTDLLVATDNYYLIAYNGNSSVTPDVLWTYNLAPNNNNTGNINRLEAFQLISDLTGDGIDDIVIGTGGGSESIIAINAATGEMLWEVGDPVNYDQGDINGIDTKRDWNNDGKPDVLATASGNEFSGLGRFSVYLLNGMTGGELWRIDQSSQSKLKDAVVSTDVGGAFGSRQAGSTTGEIFGFNKTGQLIWSVQTAGGVWGMVEVPDIGRTASSDLVYGDIYGNIKAVDGEQGQILWTTSIGNSFVEDLILVPDMNGNGVKDILVSALIPTLYLLDGATGSTIWTTQSGNNILGAGLIGDLNNDSIPELGMASLDNKASVHDGKTGTAIFTHSFGTGGSYAAECIWGIDDIDKSNVPDFAAGSRDGQIIVFAGGYKVIVGTGNDIIGNEMNYELLQNYPNPFNPVTNIRYRLAVAARVTLRVYDVLGNEVVTLVNEEKEAGPHNFIFDSSRYGLSSGVYMYKLEAGGFTSTKKLVLLK
ncbi:MAG: choice-of-anchor D domain-containing protein [Ignavibacteriaceae bacterium]|nr:choice-of-anchor D domain-containing protein [Ignavibacteriaceae bacterium]